MPRKKTEISIEIEGAENEKIPVSEELSTKDEVDKVSEETPEALETSKEKKETTKKRKSSKSVKEEEINTDLFGEVLTIDVDSNPETISPQYQQELAWHNIRNAHRSHKILTGILSGVEKTDTGNSIAVVYYQDHRVVIPVDEMVWELQDGGNYGDMDTRKNKILNNMLGAEIDFIIKGLDNKSRSIVASRRDAALKKRKLFYLDADTNGIPKIYPNKLVEARVIATASKVVRVEIFGVETSILARDLSYDWIGDAREDYHVGDQILVNVSEVNVESVDNITIKADVKSVTGNTSRNNLTKCKIQGKYAGKITDVHKGVVFLRLNTGVNAIAHTCLDSRMPAPKDDVSFVITHIDNERGVAVGLITRIIKQNI